jgi:hypothetical protein
LAVLSGDHVAESCGSLLLPIITDRAKSILRIDSLTKFDLKFLIKNFDKIDSLIKIQSIVATECILFSRHHKIKTPKLNHHKSGTICIKLNRK